MHSSRNRTTPGATKSGKTNKHPTPSNPKNNASYHRRQLPCLQHLLAHKRRNLGLYSNTNAPTHQPNIHTLLNGSRRINSTLYPRDLLRSKQFRDTVLRRLRIPKRRLLT